MKSLVKVLVSLVIAISIALGSAVSAFASGTVTTYSNRASTTQTCIAGTARTAVVGFGDSVPAGTNAGGTNYVELVGQAESATRDTNVTNYAIPGLTTSGLWGQLQLPSVQQSISSADLILITIGANDLSLDDAGAADESAILAAENTRVDQILDLINRLRRPSSQVVMTDYWNVFEDGAVATAEGAAYVNASDELTERLNAVLSESALTHGDIAVDLESAFGSGDVTSLLADDGDHPNAAGHAVIARAVLAAVTASGGTTQDSSPAA